MSPFAPLKVRYGGQARPRADFEPGAGRRIAVRLWRQLGGVLLPLGVIQLELRDAAVLEEHVAAVLLAVIAGLVGAQRIGGADPAERRDGTAIAGFVGAQ